MAVKFLKSRLRSRSLRCEPMTKFSMISTAAVTEAVSEHRSAMWSFHIRLVSVLMHKNMRSAFVWRVSIEQEKERDHCKYVKIISNFTHNYSSATHFTIHPACSSNFDLSSCFIISCNIAIPLSISIHFCNTPNSFSPLRLRSLSIDFHSLQTGDLGSIVAQCTLAKSFIFALHSITITVSMLLLLVKKNPLLVDIWHLIRFPKQTQACFSAPA